MRREKTRARRILAPVLSALILIVLIALAVFLIANRDRLSLDHFNRAIQYRGLGTAAQAETFHFIDSASNRFVTLGEGIAVASVSGLSVYDRTGNLVYSELFSMRQPVIRESGGFVLAYDLGGTAIRVGNTREILLELSWEESLIDVSLNENGWLAVSHEQDGTRGVVVVVNPEGDLAFRVYSRERYLIGAALGSDNRSLAVLTAMEQGAAVHWYSTVDRERQWEFLKEGELFFDIWFTDRREIALISGNMLLYLTHTGEIRREYHFFDRYLRGYTRSEGTVALRLSPHQTGAGGNFVLLSGVGEEREIEIQGTPVDISLAGRYFAALFIDRLLLYRNGQEYALFDETEGMTRVLTREDGSVFRLSTQRARLLIP